MDNNIRLFKNIFQLKIYNFFFASNVIKVIYTVSLMFQTYIGDNETVRGIPVQQWQSVIKDDVYDFTLDYFFSSTKTKERLLLWIDINTKTKERLLLLIDINTDV